MRFPWTESLWSVINPASYTSRHCVSSYVIEGNQLWLPCWIVEPYCCVDEVHKRKTNDEKLRLVLRGGHSLQRESQYCHVVCVNRKCHGGERKDSTITFVAPHVHSILLMFAIRPNTKKLWVAMELCWIFPAMQPDWITCFVSCFNLILCAKQFPRRQKKGLEWCYCK